MKNTISKAALSLGAASLLLFSSCGKDDDTPKPVEQELITTVRLTFTHPTSNIAPVSFTYKVANGFNNTTPGAVQIDTVRLEAGTSYFVQAELYNEKANPVDTVTNEVLAESNEHLFLYLSTPDGGSGSLTPVAGSGSPDAAGNPFNQKVQLLSGPAGGGNLRLVLIHQPTDKAAQTPDAAGGETDVDVVFPVLIR